MKQTECGMECKRNCTDYCKNSTIEDNPVPSLDLLMKAFSDGANIMYNISRNRNSFTFDPKAEFSNWCKQNGVETDKEQPDNLESIKEHPDDYKFRSHYEIYDICFHDIILDGIIRPIKRILKDQTVDYDKKVLQDFVNIIKKRERTFHPCVKYNKIKEDSCTICLENTKDGDSSLCKDCKKLICPCNGGERECYCDY